MDYTFRNIEVQEFESPYFGATVYISPINAPVYYDTENNGGEWIDWPKFKALMDMNIEFVSYYAHQTARESYATFLVRRDEYPAFKAMLDAQRQYSLESVDDERGNGCDAGGTGVQ